MSGGVKEWRLVEEASVHDMQQPTQHPVALRCLVQS